MNVKEEILRTLELVDVKPRRLTLDIPPGVEPTVSMIRGVWGAALRLVSPDAYREVFEKPEKGSPGYILRPCVAVHPSEPAVEWTLIGPAIAWDEVSRRAWDIAGGMGLGPERRPFVVKSWAILDARGRLSPSARAGAWRLDRAAWPWSTRIEKTPCRLVFPFPLRLLREKRLIERPTLPDLALAVLRRVAAYLPEPERGRADRLKPEVLRVARETMATPWSGERLDFVRYSGRQKREIEQRGVCGSLELPEGPGPIWPLLAAAQWLHVGKGTILGLGRLVIEPSESVRKIVTGRRRGRKQ